MTATRTTLSELFSDETYFLSRDNPTATADQRYLEAQALELLDTAPVAQAIHVATMRYHVLAGSAVPDEAKPDMAARMREWAYHYITLALNSDPNYPKVLGHVLGPPHEWFGMKVPGTRGPGTGENVDNHYSVIPLDPYSRFELAGNVQDPPIGDCPMYVTGNISQSQNVAGLDWRDIEFNDDGTFLITIDPDPADGRPNHMQTTIDARFLFIRDGRENWSQKPNAYRIRRLDPPLGPELTVRQLADLAVRYIVEDVPVNWWYRQMVAFVDANTITEPANSGPVGGMPSQVLLRGRVDLADDEAYVLTLSAGGSHYWSLATYDWWMMSGDYGSRTTSFNNTQSVANTDGTYTYVFAITDPGVHNWIDTEGRHQTTFMNRWQLLPKNAADVDPPTATGRLVKLADLRSVMPEGTTWVTAEQRAQQLAERVQSFIGRFAV